PLQILQAQAPALAGAVLNWRPLNLSKRHHLYLPSPHHRGHDLPRFPFWGNSFPFRGRVGLFDFQCGVVSKEVGRAS
ncbi:MAG TPA: hypothetical protein VNO52_10075, partial [Methylomirabilota bacterium]|nr:hypothetical protein [Methylomirabilota bacterium]